MSWVSGHPRTRPAPAAAALRWVGARLAGRDSALRQADWLLFAAVVALSLVGTLLIWSATEPMLTQQGANPHAFLLKQLLNIALGVVLMLIVSSLDARQLRLYAPILYIVSCIGLLAVLTPLGSIVNGAKSWISIGAGFQVEPSEFAKLAVIVISAMLLSDVRHGQTRPSAKSVSMALGVAAVPILLVVAEPDLGVTIVMVLILVGLVALSGVRLRWLVGMLAAAAVTIAAVVQLHLLKAYQVSRLTSFANPSADPRGTGYSAAQATIAIGSGGMHGTGLFHSQLIAGSFVPEQHTDFIFAVVGNELGFVGSCAVIGLLGLLLFCALRIATKAEDQFGTLVASGIAIWFAVQAFVNIGMNIGIMPVTGLPLPFVSYGGSAMFADMMAIGLLQSVRRRRCVFTDEKTPAATRALASRS
ncbi:MAG TPA: rod shape-determining protein RodA [Streptosporangiaceae bacterium]|nr:rod shape-determining protein RodA [Streptosporangiaceae bacterium]